MKSWLRPLSGRWSSARASIFRLWSIFCIFLISSSSAETLAPASIMRIETFDTVDQASFCDARRFDVVEGTSGLIYSHKPYYPSSVYRPSRDCFMTLKAPVGYRIELMALEFQVGERFAGQSRKCAGDSLHIFDQDKPDPSPKKARSQPSEYQDEKSLAAILSSNTSVQSPIKANLCGRLKNNTIIARSTMHIMTLWWHSETAESPTPPSDRLQSSVAKRGFKLQWTAFRESSNTGCDEEKEFTCSNQNTCIPVELVCDNVAHCNDKSDLLPDRQRAAGCVDVESEASSASSAVNIGSLAGVCIGALLLLVLAMILFSICRRRQRSARRQHKYNQAPVVTSSVPDKRYTDGGGGGGANTATTSGLAPNSSNSSSDNSRCPSSSTDSRNNAMVSNRIPLTHPYAHHQNALYHQIDSDAVGPVVMPNGTYYQPYYMAENGVPYQTNLYHQHQHQHHHHHHPQPPTAPPPSMVNGNVGANYPTARHHHPYYQQQQGLNDAAQQPMIA